MLIDPNPPDTTPERHPPEAWERQWYSAFDVAQAMGAGFVASARSATVATFGEGVLL